MNAIVFISLLMLSFGVFAIPKRFKYYYALLIMLISVAITSWWALQIFRGSGSFSEIGVSLPFLHSKFLLVIDRLSAFFILIINLTVTIGFLYAYGYLKPYFSEKNSLRFSIHYFSYLWLYFSMLLVSTTRDGFSFLVVWEIMALSSFLLVIFDAEERSIMKTGINYLIQMHIGMAFILTALLIVEKSTGTMSFDALPEYFSSHSNILVFCLFFIGFGIKAGFVPIHTWLPQAHPAAPSHVSGVMSGVMIKMGIYGIVRVLFSVQQDLLVIGVIILIISVISGLFGVMMAIIQHDLKRLLAYHSIENIGIIGIGIGLGVIGMANHNTALIILGFGGGLLHVLNHSLFKALLFYNAGSVYHATHTRNIEKMGGLMKKMPVTAMFFLIGSLAICGLPPFNGFISEYLIYVGMFKSLAGAGLYQSILLLFSIAALALIGGLAVFCFTKAFGIVFLGSARSGEMEHAHEVEKSMLLPQWVIIFFIAAIGLASSVFVIPVMSIVSESVGVIAPSGFTTLHSVSQISIIGGIFVVLVTVLLTWRHFHMKNKTVVAGPTWGCGYTAPSPKLQYTATSYADNYLQLANPLLRSKVTSDTIEGEEYFPGVKRFETHSKDVVKTAMTDAPVNKFLELLKKIAVMQTGQIQHYILYAFVFMLLIFVLTYFNLI
ncbi:MAG TPA: proton-conducting transporter membrane subunit [Bacteroidales bacterium]|nr:proton-conducting transporter membrane subunit [Bacteroidales bacterium]